MRITLPALALVMTSAPATGQTAPADGAAATFARAVACRTITTPEERLACFDREVAALARAEAAQEIRVLDRQQVRRARRSLFGLTLPDLDLFGGGDGDEQGVSEINAIIRSVSQDPTGKWIFVLDDGARWAQIDSRQLGIDPRPGQPIRIRRAAMGSFLANVNRQVAVRVQRRQ